MLQHEMHAVGLSLTACEKSVQIVYERNLRPATAQYAPWLERVTGQLLAAYAGLEQQVQGRPSLFASPRTQSATLAAVAWQFTQSMLAVVVPVDNHPALVVTSERMERTPGFQKYPPVGPGVAASNSAPRSGRA